MGLRDLDDRFLPSWARRVQQARASVAAAPSPAEVLRGLDDRYAGNGTLRVVRDAPVLVALLALAVLLAGAGTSLALSWSTAGAVAAGPRVLVLGPPLGADVEAYLAQARELAQQAAVVPESERAAYAAAAETAGREAAAYATDCACVLALLVQGTAAELAELPALPVVRGVELAPCGASAGSVQLRPLAPGATGAVQ